MAFTKIVRLRKEFYDKVMDTAFYYQTGRTTEDGSELKFEAHFNAAWDCIYLNEYKVKFDGAGGCKVTTLTERNIYLTQEIKTVQDYVTISDDVFAWLDSICKRPTKNRKRGYKQ